MLVGQASKHDPARFPRPRLTSEQVTALNRIFNYFTYRLARCVEIVLEYLASAWNCERACEKAKWRTVVVCGGFACLDFACLLDCLLDFTFFG